MTEIMLVGTFHYPGNFDVFSHDLQNQIEDFTNILATFNPNKIAAVLLSNSSDIIRVF